MRTPKYRKIDSYSARGNDIIKRYMNDDRDNVNYHDSWAELMNILEVMENNYDKTSDYVGYFEIGRHKVKITTKYKVFQKTFMYHDYRTRKAVVHEMIVKALTFHLSEDKKTLDKYVNEGVIDIKK